MGCRLRGDEKWSNDIYTIVYYVENHTRVFRVYGGPWMGRKTNTNGICKIKISPHFGTTCLGQIKSIWSETPPFEPNKVIKVMGGVSHDTVLPTRFLDARHVYLPFNRVDACLVRLESVNKESKSPSEHCLPAHTIPVGATTTTPIDGGRLSFWQPTKPQWRWHRIMINSSYHDDTSSSHQKTKPAIRMRQPNRTYWSSEKHMMELG